MDGTLLSDTLRYKNAFKGDIPEHLKTCMEIIQEIGTTIPRISNPRTDWGKRTSYAFFLFSSIVL